ncbi:hypothetical protein SDJN02_03427, partial [Cucurbita argyrosperma subsp. argyrosperma]
MSGILIAVLSFGTFNDGIVVDFVDCGEVVKTVLSGAWEIGQICVPNYLREKITVHPSNS